MEILLPINSVKLYSLARTTLSLLRTDVSNIGSISLETASATRENLFDENDCPMLTLKIILATTYTRGAY